MNKSILPLGALGAAATLTKANVKGYTRADGTYVRPHTTGRPPASGSGSGSSYQDVLRNKDHRLVVAAASRGEFDLQHAVEKHALGKDISGDFGEYGPSIKKMLESMGKEHVAAASRGEIDMQHEAEKAALGKSAGGPMKKAILLFGEGIGDLAKAHVDSYTRADGTVVRAHDTSVQAASKGQSGSSGSAGQPAKYKFPEHVITSKDRVHHLNSVPKSKRTPEWHQAHKVALKQSVTGGFRRHSDEYLAHMESKKKR